MRPGSSRLDPSCLRATHLALATLLLSGCYLVSPDDAGDDPGVDEVPLPPVDAAFDFPEDGPIGRSFAIRRTPKLQSCTSFSEEHQLHVIDVLPNNVIIDDHSTSNIVVNPDPAFEAALDPPNVAFTVFEHWNAPAGPADVEVHYQIWIAGFKISGHANAEFVFEHLAEPANCRYEWTIPQT